MRVGKLKLNNILALFHSEPRQRTLPSSLVGYGFATACVLATFALRYALTPLIDSRLSLMIFVPSVLLAAYCGGAGPGLLALALGFVIGEYFVVPSHSFGHWGPVDF